MQYLVSYHSEEGVGRARVSTAAEMGGDHSHFLARLLRYVGGMLPVRIRL